MACSLAACDSGEPHADIGSEWRRVDLLGATATSIAWHHVYGAVVETELDGIVGAVQVDWHGPVEPIQSPNGDEPLLGLFPGGDGPVVVTGADDGTLLFRQFIDGTDVILESELATPEPQLEPLAVWWGTEDEGAILVAAYRQPDGTVGIHPMDWETYTFEPRPMLFVDPDRLDEVQVAAREEDTIVVGPIGADPTQLPTRDQVWAMQTTADFTADGEWVPRAWRAVSLDPRPDFVTDVEGWEGDVVLAGRVDNHPLVWKVDVEQVDLPDLELGTDGSVLIADPFWLGDDPAIGLQTAEGSVILLPGDEDWEQVELPGGRLDDVVAIPEVRSFEEDPQDPSTPGEGRLLAIVEGVVWMRAYWAQG